MASIGHRTGLFDTMADMPPATSEGIAKLAGLNERYVREWLGAMVTGGVVDYDPAGRRYHLPLEHAACLTRRAASDNMAGLTQWFPVLGSVEDRIIDCFRNGGSLAYGDYQLFHEVMAEESGQTVVAALVGSILPLAPGLVARLRCGIEVLDIGCGSGRALVRMAREFPNSRFTGYDLCTDAIEAASAGAREYGLSNARFAVCDVATLGDRTRFDLITAFDAIHDQADPARVLRNIAGALRDDGVFLMQDIGVSSELQRNLEHPIGTLIYTISCLHCMSVSLGQGGAGLGAAWGGELALEMLAEAGFGNVTVERLPHDFQNFYYLCAKA